MNLTRGLLAAVGAFWSEVIPPYVPADYEDHTAHLDPDFEVPGSLLCHFCDLPSGHDGPHKDCMCGKCSPVVEVADSIFRSGGQTFQTGPGPKLATTHGGKCRCGHWLHPGNVCAACGCNDVRLAAVSEPPVVPVAVDEPPFRADGAHCCGGGGNWGHEWNCKVLKELFLGHPAGVESPPAPPVGLPIFKASELVTVAAEYISEHYLEYHPDGKSYCRCDTGPFLRMKHATHVAELVVSALVAELTSLAYEQQK